MICLRSRSVGSVDFDPVRVPVTILKFGASAFQPGKKSAGRRAKLFRELENSILNFIVSCVFTLAIELG